MRDSSKAGRLDQWILYSDNLELAKEYVTEEIKDQLSRNYFNVKIWHIALSLGMNSFVRDILKLCQPKKDRLYYSLQFRLDRFYGEANPYSNLYPDYSIEEASKIIEEQVNKGMLRVALNGGLGDQLEAISVLKPLANKVGARLELDLNENSRRIISSSLDRSKISVSQKIGINYSFIRFWMCNIKYEAIYSSWLTQFESNNRKDNYFLFCWQARGKGDKFSSHSRSVSFTDIMMFYKEIHSRFKNPNIVDITNWNVWERKSINKMKINEYDPLNYDMSTLSKMIDGRTVITIDTALAHLCAAKGKKAYLLLPMFPDERWEELQKKENSYGSNLTIIRQSKFNNWQNELVKVIKFMQD